MNLKELKIKKIFFIIKVILLLIISILIIYMIIINNRLDKTNYPPSNALEVSPLTGKENLNLNQDKIIYNIEYLGSDIFSLHKIYENDIIYEIYDKKTDSRSYKAASIKNIGSHKDIVPLQSNTTNNFPKLSFINYSDKKNFISDNFVSDVFIEYGPLCSTGLIYTNGHYKYLNSVTQEDVHQDTNEPLSFANIVIQFINPKDKTKGEGILFTGGLSKEIVWDNNDFYFKKGNKPMILNKGNSLWVPLDISLKDRVIYNK